MALYSKPAAAREVKQSTVSLGLLRRMAFFVIALFLWNMEFLNHRILLTLLRTQTEFNHLVEEMKSTLSRFCGALLNP